MNARGSDPTLFDPGTAPASQSALGILGGHKEIPDLPPVGEGPPVSRTPRPRQRNGGTDGPATVGNPSDDGDGRRSQADLDGRARGSRILPPHVMPPNLATMPLVELRAAQDDYKKFRSLDAEAKAAARQLHAAFEGDLIRLAIKHQVHSDQLHNYLRDQRNHRPSTNYNSFSSLDPGARRIHEDTTKSFEDRSAAVAQKWNELTPAQKALWRDPTHVAQSIAQSGKNHQANESQEAGTSKRSRGGYDYKAWARTVDTQMKALRHTERFEGFMVLVPIDSDRPAHVIHTPLGEQYLIMCNTKLGKSPFDDFARLVNGKGVEAALLGGEITSVTRGKEPPSRVRGRVAPHLAHLATLKLNDLRRGVTDALNSLLSEALEGAYVRGWPGTSTEESLREMGLKLQIDEDGSEFKHTILFKPARDWTKDEAVQVRHALDKGWISLRKLPSDTPTPRPKAKRKYALKAPRKSRKKQKDTPQSNAPAETTVAQPQSPAVPSTEAISPNLPDEASDE